MARVEVEAVDAVRRRLAVEIPAEQVTAELERAYDALRRKARVRGFRQGRAPRSVLENLFGDQMRADVFNKLVNESYTEAIRDRSIQAVSAPEIVTETAEPGQPLRYSATVEIKPTLVPDRYDGLRVERPLRVIAEGDVDRFLGQLQQSAALMQPITDRREARRGDVATVDYEARIGDRLAAKREHQLVEVGGGEQGIEARLEGSEVGSEVAFDLDYPADHVNPDLAGQSVSFRVRVRSIAHKELPSLDDDFAKTHGGCETLAALRQRVRERLESAAARDADSAVRAALVSQLIGGHQFDVPQSMVERRTEGLIEEFLENLGPRRPAVSREADLRARLRTDLASRALDQVKAGLVLEAIAARERLQVTDDELEAQVDQFARNAGGAEERVRALYRDPEARAGLRSRVLQERALDLVAERAHVETVEPPSGVAGEAGNR